MAPISEQREAHGSAAWRVFLRGFLRAAPTPIMREVRRRVPDAPIEEVIFVGRRSGRERRLLLNVYDVDGRWYIGHPNGTSHWVRNLEATGTCTVIGRDGIPVRVSASELAHGPERDAVLDATGRQPPPAGYVYRRARRHVDAMGRYFRLTPIEATSTSR